MASTGNTPNTDTRGTHDGEDDAPVNGKGPPGRRRAAATVVAAAAAVLAVGGVLWLGGNGNGGTTAGGADASSESASPADLDAGTVIPSELGFERFENGQATFADLRGKPAVLNFWASWCPACVSEMPDFESVHRQFGDTVSFVGFDVQDTREAAIALADETGVTYTLADDTDGAFHRAFGGFAMPATVFLAADGTIVEVHNGILTEGQLTERLEDILEAS